MGLASLSCLGDTISCRFCGLLVLTISCSIFWGGSVDVSTRVEQIKKDGNNFMCSISMQQNWKSITESLIITLSYGN